ncbi:MAG TPA: exodeoxyribonuclease VII small subunit [Candidatus Avirikenella pullistercoris]|nr:exodeoxyribonuclease VII small subunit [Candidatus Avirikenella pullistercoris]
MSYQEAVEEVNAILDRLNNEELDIDQLSKEVKRATELINLCKGKLRKAQEEVEKVFDKK